MLIFIIERWSSMKCFKWDQSLPYFALEKTRIIFAELNEWYCQTRTRSWSKRITKHIHSIIILCRVIQSVNTSHGRKASLFTDYLNEQVSKMHCPSQLELTTHLPASLSQDFSKFQEPNPRIKNIIFRAVFFFPGKKSNPCGVFKKHSGWQVGKVQSTRLFLSNQKNPLPTTRQGTEFSTLCLKEHSYRPLSRWDHVPLGYCLSHRPGAFFWSKEMAMTKSQRFVYVRVVWIFGSPFMGRIGAFVCVLKYIVFVCVCVSDVLRRWMLYNILYTRIDMQLAWISKRSSRTCRTFFLCLDEICNSSLHSCVIPCPFF